MKGDLSALESIPNRGVEEFPELIYRFNVLS